MYLPEDPLAGIAQRQADETAAIKGIFVARARKEDIATEWRLQRSVSMTVVEGIIESARAAGLVVLA